MSKKTPTILAAICERIAKGESLRAICETEGMPAASTVCGWLADDAKFAEQYARAREAQADYYADEIVAIADAAMGQPSENVQAARLAVDARKWVASKLKPKRYGDKVDVEHAGELIVRIVD